MENPSNAIELKGIRKTFGSVVACDSVDLSVKKGEILALLGENGSGKTTLMNVLSGIYRPDEGEIFIDGRPVFIHSPEDSKRHGIGMVHQHFKLVDNFSAADNIWLGVEGESEILKKSRYDKIKEMAEYFGFNIEPSKIVYDMSVSEKQTVEILKVLYYGADILILDEPTAVLTLQETNKLFDVLRKMKRKGCSVIIITHKLNEVLEISDRVTVLRKGRSVGTVETSQTDSMALTELMVGKKVSLEIRRSETEKGTELLRFEDVSVTREDGTRALEKVSFSLYGGEILGVAGVSGCGQKELCEAIAGLCKTQSGEIYFENEKISGKTPREIIKHGISMSFIPEDRLGTGLSASLSITDNMMLKNYIDAPGIFVDRKTARKSAVKVIDELEVVTPGTEVPVRRLSGGNVQKILLGREIQSNPKVLVTAYPVRGLDINSSYTIYDILNRQKESGSGVLYAGEDLDVMLELCDRIMVLCHGKVTGIVDACSTTKEELGLLMTDAASMPAVYDKEEETSSSSADVAKKTKKKGEFKKARKPLLSIVKKDEPKLAMSFLMYALAILAAVVAGGIFIAAMGVNPIEYYKTLIVGCFSNAIHIKGLIRILIPLIITSIGIAVAFKMKFWNIGANGQFIMGAISAATVALAVNDSLPRIAVLILMLLAGAVGGGIYGMLTAVFKVKFGTNETLLTLMLNYIAYYILAYLKNVLFFRKLSPTGALLRPDFKALPESGHIYTMQIGDVTFDISLIIAVVLVIAVFVYLKFTKSGYEISVVGDSVGAAKYAGMNVGKVMIRTMFISAAIVGVAGMLHVSGTATNHTLSTGITNDVGWTGIIVAWLAKLNPFGILVTSFFMAILQKGSAVAESGLNISSASSDILQGIILFTVLAADFFYRYKIVFAKNKAQ